MKRNVFRPFLFATLIVLIVGLACSSAAPATPTATPMPPSDIPTPVPPTSTSTPTKIPPTATATPWPAFFKEEFNTDVLGRWDSFVLKDSAFPNSDKRKSKVVIENGKLTFTLEDEGLHSHLIYDKQTYDNVRVEISADNRGKNNNFISLICRYSNAGWYEFTMMSSGMFQIWAVDLTGAVHRGYNLIASSGSNAINMGVATNVYAIVCSDNQLTLYINGEKATSIPENKYNLTDGKVGINVSSLNVFPIIVDVEYFDIQEP